MLSLDLNSVVLSMSVCQVSLLSVPTRLHHSSAPLVKLDRDTCVAIDALIDVFLEQHVPNEFSKLKKETCTIWMAMVPFVHELSLRCRKGMLL